MNSYYEEQQLWINYKNTIINKINDNGVPLVLFGKTTVVDEKFLKDIKVPVEYIVDNDSRKWGEVLWGLDIVSFDEIKEKYNEYTLLILVPFVEQITEQVINSEKPPKDIYYLDLYFEEEDSASFFEENRNVINEIKSNLTDKESKNVFDTVINYRINRNPKYLKGIVLPRKEQYFPNILDGRAFLNDNEVFIDVGAFLGDTVQIFLEKVNKKYNKIFAFEPEIVNYNLLVERTKGLNNIICKQVGVGKKKDKIRFSTDTSSSKADVNGDEIVCIEKLDDILRDEKVTYIKMDVEGMECAALYGAKNVIRDNHPKLAICTYHSNADMIDIPKLIWKIDPTYKLYFRHYTNALVETVCYAI